MKQLRYLIFSHLHSERSKTVVVKKQFQSTMTFLKRSSNHLHHAVWYELVNGILVNGSGYLSKQSMYMLPVEASIRFLWIQNNYEQVELFLFRTFKQNERKLLLIKITPMALKLSLSKLLKHYCLDLTILPLQLMIYPERSIQLLAY